MWSIFSISRQRGLLALIIVVCALRCLPAAAAASAVDPELLVPRESPVWVDIAQATIPRLVVETEGGYQFKLPSSGDGVRRLTIGTDHLAAIRRFWHDDSYRSSGAFWPVLQTTVEWNPASGAYTLTRVELGFFNRWVWLVHELPDTEDRYGSIGIQIKLEW